MMFRITLLFLSLFVSLPAMAEPLTIQTGRGKTYVFDVEIADTDAKRQKGLMGRKELPDNEGMLFLMGKTSMVRFWMKDTPIPLDLLYIDETGTVLGVIHSAKPYDETPMEAPAPAFAILEIGGNLAKKLQISPGSKVVHKVFEKDLK